MGRIKMFLIDAEHPEAVSLLRAAREVWPGEEFGSHGIALDDEMEIMRGILFNPVAGEWKYSGLPLIRPPLGPVRVS